MDRVPPPGPDDGRGLDDTLSFHGEPEPGAGPTESVPSALARGSIVHRYIILDRVGEGGMGVVYAAYDRTLDRRVALKFLHPHASDRGGIRETRMLREAQAMARLSHPNVAVVYEVGTFAGTVFLAMEFVDGVDLRKWLAAKPRSLTNMLEVFRAAGRGLAAAHEAGIIHRDFKPENVLLDRQDRPRVTDFGLSRTSHEPEEPAADPAAGDPGTGLSSPSHLSTPLTRTGTMLGTPPYMPPEQHRGLAADARADQFAFCVALYEATAGVLPFGGTTPVEIDQAIVARQITPAASAMPRWLRAAVVRGLEPEPRDRWPSMEALLEALARSPGPASRRWLLGGAVALGLVAAASIWSMSSDREACPAARDKVAGIWDGPTRQKVRAAFLATGAPYAADLFARVERALDARLDGWVDAHREACLATRVRGEQSEAMLDLRMQCLERARRQIAALPEIWQKSSKLDGSVRAALTVGDVEACSDAAALATSVPLPHDPETARQLEALRRVLDRVEAMRQAGQVEEGLGQARDAVAEARRIGYAPVLAEGLYQNGRLEADYGTLDVGIDLLHDAYRVANEARDDVRAAITSRLLLFYTVTWAKRLADADLLWKMAEAAVARVSDNDDLVADLLATKGSVRSEQGRLTEAADYLHRAVALKEKLHGPDDLRLAPWLHNLGAVLADLGRSDEALAIGERERAIFERAVGPEHPYMADVLNNLSLLLGDLEDYEGAARAAERALAIRSKTYPADHPVVAAALYTLAMVRMAQERDDEARELFERTARIREKALGPEHPQLASTRNYLANLAVLRGDIVAARALIDQVLPIKRKVYGEDHRTMAVALETLGDVLVREKDLRGARSAYQRELAILRKQGEDHPEVASALIRLGDLALREGKSSEAIAHFERAKELLEKSEGTHRTLLVPVLTGLGRAHFEAGRRSEAVAILEGAAAMADAHPTGLRFAGARARFELARALWTSGERARAASLARAARDELAGRREVDDIDLWLRRHSTR